MDLIDKIKNQDLRGRGGAEFPVADKWRAVARAHKKRPQDPVYVVCNASEGEPGVTKDMYILQHYPREVVAGMVLAMKTLGAKKGVIYIKEKNYKKIKTSLVLALKGKPISVFLARGGYLCGEETTLLEDMAGARREPRLKPPFPTEYGWAGCPTLVNNVETFYYVARIQKNAYQRARFYSLSGAVNNLGVYELPIDLNIGDILEKTGNTPRFKFFVQVGGGAAGEILKSDELDQPLKGAGSIIVYRQSAIRPVVLMKRWLKFFFEENCGKCVPCREGVYRLREELNKKVINWSVIRALLHTLKDTSLCPLGRSVYDPMMSLMEKIGVVKDSKIKKLKN